MTNEEYQRQAAERSRQDAEAARRRSMEEFNQAEKARHAKIREDQNKSYSKMLGGTGAPPPLMGPGVHLPTYLRARAGYNARQKMIDGMQPKPSIGGGFSSAGRARSSGGGGSKVRSGMIVLTLIVCGLFYLGSKGSDHPAKIDNPTPTPAATPTLPKPSPYPAKPETPSSLESTATPANPGAPDVGVPSSEPTVQPVATAAAPMRLEADRKGARNGCKGGELAFTPSRIDFTCPGDPSKGVAIMRAQVKGIDDDGVQLLTNDKYHFKIPRNSSEEVKRLFTSWLNTPVDGAVVGAQSTQ